jgi:hypothetical protein
MDADRFDFISRFAGSPETRRRLLGGLGAGTLTAALTVIDAEARRKKKKKKSKACPQGTLRCGKQCVNVQTDRSNCGSCGNRCPAHSPNCEAGQCKPNACAANSLYCATQRVICGESCACGSKLDGTPFCSDCGFCHDPQCESDEDCVGFGLPEGSVCGKGGGGGCQNCPGTANICLTPCGSCGACGCIE